MNVDGVEQCQHTLPHYRTGPYQRPATVLADEEYGRALDVLVKGCNDLLLVHNEKFLLAERRDYPQRTWWFACGGRIKAGESIAESGSRLLSRELTLSIAPEEMKKRQRTVIAFGFTWAVRMQAPMLNGTADISIVTAITVSDEESLVISSNTFENRQWISFHEIVNNKIYHPALKRTVQEYHRIQWYDRLDTLVQTRESKYVRSNITNNDEKVSDKDIVDEFSSYLAFSRDISKRDNEIIYTDEVDFPPVNATGASLPTELIK